MKRNSSVVAHLFMRQTKSYLMHRSRAPPARDTTLQFSKHWSSARIASRLCTLSSEHVVFIGRTLLWNFKHCGICAGHIRSYSGDRRRREDASESIMSTEQSILEKYCFANWHFRTMASIGYWSCNFFTGKNQISKDHGQAVSQSHKLTELSRAMHSIVVIEYKWVEIFPVQCSLVYGCIPRSHMQICRRTSRKQLFLINYSSMGYTYESVYVRFE